MALLTNNVSIIVEFLVNISNRQTIFIACFWMLNDSDVIEFPLDRVTLLFQRFYVALHI